MSESLSDVLITGFNAYRQRCSLTTVRMKDVPADMQPLVRIYLHALTAQLADPENQSWDKLGPDEHHNALQAVVASVAAKPHVSVGNCPKCAGTGFILAYSHVRGGRCLKCDGSGNVAT
ncbi:hypothetical protein F2S72_09175 [Pseudomonas syringae pv. actinidiae]|nr:hypothetical protein [Pseudomonas syringae pv. actinidiae]